MVKSILASHWSFILYVVIFIRHSKVLIPLLILRNVIESDLIDNYTNTGIKQEVRAWHKFYKCIIETK